MAARDRTMLLVFLDTGIRVTELANLNMEDVYLDEGMIKVIGKDDKERLVPIGLKVQKTSGDT
jgi:site-specific recombinase XerD